MTSKKTHIKAFTLTEVIVTLAVSSIVISLAYYTYNTLNLYYAMMEKRNDTFAERLNLRYFLNKDLEESDSIKYFQNELICYSDSSVIKWQPTANDSALLRKQDLDIKEFEVNRFIWHMITDQKTGYINNVNIYFFQEKDTVHFSYYKKYPVWVYLNK